MAIEPNVDGSYDVDGVTIAMPVEVRAARQAAATFLVPHAAAVAVFGECGLNPTNRSGKSIVSVALVDYTDNDLGSYKELALAVVVDDAPGTPPTPKGSVSTLIHRLPVSEQFTCAAGRGIWGFPKWVADLRVDFNERGASATLRNDDGDDACDPASVCEIALRMANSQVKHRATLSLECEEIGDVTISASRLSQVVINLLTNAAESFSAADPTINRVELSVRRCGNCALVTVRDNGPGIDAATLDRVFEPFFTTKPAVGTGLGLSISRQLVDAAGGNVHISSEPGRGTTVTVRLPAVEVAETNDSRPDEHLGAAAARRLAIVDDDARVAASLARLLGRSFDVATYSTVTDALAAWECGGAPDAVLCDLMMPDVSGADMFDLLTRTDPALARRTLFMTGGAVGAASTQFERAMLAVDRLVHKPVDAELVERLIERMTESTSVAG